MSRIRRDERGQALVISVLFVTVLLGMTGAVLDVGSWFRTQRATQATADAAALAGAQALPADPAQAMSLAMRYAGDNGAGLSPGDVHVLGTTNANDTIKVTVRRTAPGFFSHIFGITGADVGAGAAARAFQPGAAKWVAPIAVNLAHPKLSGPGCPCFRQMTTLPLDKAGAPGAFTIIVLDHNLGKGGIGSSTLGDWILHGFDAYLPVDDDYYSDPGAKFNASDIDAALEGRLNTELLFPVYDRIDDPGANAQYHVVAWAAFYLTGYDTSGKGSLSGYFTQTIWQGIETATSNDIPDLGVHSVQLVQ
jgi:hypothetical protein